MKVVFKLRIFLMITVICKETTRLFPFPAYLKNNIFLTLLCGQRGCGSSVEGNEGQKIYAQKLWMETFNLRKNYKNIMK